MRLCHVSPATLQQNFGGGGFGPSIKMQSVKEMKSRMLFAEKKNWGGILLCHLNRLIVAFCFTVCFHFHFGLSVDILHRLYKCGGWTDHYTIYT